MSKPLSYWEKRKARETYENLVPVEEKADELAKIYANASSQIEAEARRLVRKFQLKHHLSENEAEKLLTQIRSPDDIRDLLQRLKTDPKNRELVTQLESEAYGSRLTQLARLQNNVDTVTTALLSPVRSSFTDVLTNIAKRAYYQEIFGMQQRANAGFAFNPLDPARIDQILSTRWSGKNFSERIWGNTQELAEKVKSEILTGLLTGKSSFEMSKAIEERFHQGSTNSRRLMRTEATYVAGQTSLDAYKETGVNKYIYVAILDLRTSEICRDLDKKRYLVSRAMPGVNYPPMHPWCRSTTIPWMPDELLKKLRQAAIDPSTGERIYVPGDMTYNEWYEKYVESTPTPVSKEPIGPTPAPAPETLYAERLERIMARKAVTYEPVERLPLSETEETIIAEIAGWDKTDGSCSSVALAYMGRQAGYDVLDYRGGGSRAYFGNRSVKLEMADWPGVKGLTNNNRNEIVQGIDLLMYVEPDKEYMLNVGRHSAMVRQKEGYPGMYQYLELQTDSQSAGWKDFEADTFEKRFGARSCAPLTTTGVLLDAETVQNSANFKTLLPYLNTKKSNQRKGIGGSVK